MNLKSCEYCTKDFEPKRKDHRYCTDSCRSRAYVDRKAVELNVQRPTQHPEIARTPNRPAKTGHVLSDSQFNRMLNGQSQNHLMLTSILKEKEDKGDLKAELAENRLKVIMLEKEVRDKDTQISDLRTQVLGLNNQLDRSSTSKIDKLIDGLADKPENIPHIVSACQGFISQMTNPNNLTATAAISGLPTSDDDIEQELSEIEQLFPQLTLKTLLRKFIDVAHKNKTAIESFLGLS